MRAEAAWAASGAMALTGDPSGPPLAPPTDAALAVAAVLAALELDAQVLGERAALRGLGRGGSRTCGGAGRLVRTADGWIALSLPRPEDVELLPALLRTEIRGERWAEIGRIVGRRPALEVVAEAVTLGMAVGAVGERPDAPFTVTGRPRRSLGRPERPPLVVDLTALWAGPLCGDLLRRTGARVVKVESSSRPDGARHGDPRFFDLLNAHKQSVSLDLRRPAGRAHLRDLVDTADVVLSSSRARAIEGLGLDPETFLANGTDRIWVAITGHGWTIDRIGFGDDAAAAAGLVAWHEGTPRFVADAVADPLCGVLAFDAARTAWQQGGRWFVDASLTGAAARCAGPHPTVEARAATRAGRGWALDGVPVAAPRPRHAETRAAPLGTDTNRVLAELGP